MSIEFDRQHNKEEKITCIECGAHFEETSPCDGLQALGYNIVTIAERITEIKSKTMEPVKRSGGQKKNTPSDEDEEKEKEILAHFSRGTKDMMSSSCDEDGNIIDSRL
jgi:hypothetical protein